MSAQVIQDRLLKSGVVRKEILELVADFNKKFRTGQEKSAIHDFHHSDVVAVVIAVHQVPKEDKEAAPGGGTESSEEDEQDEEDKASGDEGRGDRIRPESATDPKEASPKKEAVQSPLEKLMKAQRPSARVDGSE